MHSSTPPAPWHVARWHPLAWIETGIKLVAILVGAAAGAEALNMGLRPPQGVELIQFIVLGLLSLGLVAAIIDRYLDREIIAMIFVILNNVGHWGMVLGLASDSGAASLPVFAALMLAGDLEKLAFLAISGFSVRDVPRRVLYGLTLFYVVGYAVLLLLALVG